MSVTIQTGNSVTVRSGNRVTISAPGPQGPPGSGGGGTPGGLNTQVQFNDSATFGGDAGLTYNKTTDTLTGVNQTFTGLSTLDHIHGNIAGSLYVHIKNTSGVTIAKGTPVYATGSVGSSGEVEVAAADYTNSAKMPSIGITDTQLIANAEGNAVVVGEVMGLATNGYSINQELFVGTAGLLGALPTTGEAQSIAVVSRVHASTGIIVVNAQARLNAALRALANNDGSNLTGITADQVGALDPNGDGSALTGITAAQVGALEPTGDGSALTGITAAQVGAIADGDTLSSGLTFPISGGIGIQDSTGDYKLLIQGLGDLTENRGLNFNVNDGNRTVSLFGALNVSGDSTISGTNSGNVTLAGTPDYITISGQTITRNAIDLAADITGTLPIGNGGTGQTTAVAAFDALAPTTTKGDLIVHNGTDNVRVPVGGTNGHVLTVDSAEATGVKWAAGGGGGSVLPPGWIYRLTLSNNATDANNDIDIAAGSARAADDSANLVLASALTKQLDASWAVGTNQGGLDTGSEANSTWYAVWLIRRSDTGVVDALFSTSATAPTMPTNYDSSRRIGWIYNNSSGNIEQFTQDETWFSWTVNKPDVDVSNLENTRALYRLTTPPQRLRVQFIGHFAHTTVSSGILWIGDPSNADGTPGLGSSPPGIIMRNYAAGGGVGYGRIISRTNNSGQIAARAANSNTSLRIWLEAWEDSRLP
jgi:hypothetical protein